MLTRTRSGLLVSERGLHPRSPAQHELDSQQRRAIANATIVLEELGYTVQPLHGENIIHVS